MLEPDRAWRLPCRGVNAYLLRDGTGGTGDTWTLVDAGTPWDAERIRRRLDEAGVAPQALDRVLLTHYDLDHVGSLAALDIDCPIYVAPPDDAFLAARRAPPPTNHKGLLQRLLGPLVDAPDVRVEAVDDGDRFGGLTAYRTPGHTPGHTAYVHADYGVAFVGDLVREADGDLAPSPWLVTYDVSANAESVRSLAERAPPFEVVAMGHGDPIREGGDGALRRLADRL
jgi:glyoxylase-like metal-dependent hydrolase (beta-lactamase superfamily II)